MNTKLVLPSKYMFVTTSEQVSELLELVRNFPKKLEGLQIFIDSNTVPAVRHASRINTELSYLFARSRQLGCALLIVTNPHTKLDKRIDRLLDCTSKIVSKEIKQKAVRF